MKNDLYETLGVDRSADGESIGEAFRKKARKAHPDKGGSTEEYQQLAHAYSIIKDPEKRKYYDATGQTGSIELNRQRMAIESVNYLFDKLFNSSEGNPESVDYINKISLTMKMANDGSREDIKRLKQKIAVIKKVIKRLKCKKGKTNFIKVYWDMKALELQHQILKNQEEIKVNQLARKMLKDFKFEPKDPESYSSSWMPMSALLNKSPVTAS